MNAIFGFLSKFVALPIFKYIVDKIFASVNEWIKTQKAIAKIKSDVKAKIKELRKEPDAQKRSKLIDDYLSGL